MLLRGGAKIEFSIFDIILVMVGGFPSFLLVRGAAKIGIFMFDVIFFEQDHFEIWGISFKGRRNFPPVNALPPCGLEGAACPA